MFSRKPVSTHRAVSAQPRISSSRCITTSGSMEPRSFSPPRSRHSSWSPPEGIDIPQNVPPIVNTLQENVHATPAVLDHVEAFTIPSHAASPIIRNSTSTCALRRRPHARGPHLRSRRTPRRLQCAMHCRSIPWAGSACCTISRTRRSRKACESLARRLRGQELVEVRPR
jgi:hypothetical protein